MKQKWIVEIVARYLYQYIYIFSLHQMKHNQQQSEDFYTKTLKTCDQKDSEFEFIQAIITYTEKAQITAFQLLIIKKGIDFYIRQKRGKINDLEALKKRLQGPIKCYSYIEEQRTQNYQLTQQSTPQDIWKHEKITQFENLLHIQTPLDLLKIKYPWINLYRYPLNTLKSSSWDKLIGRCINRLLNNWEKSKGLLIQINADIDVNRKAIYERMRDLLLKVVVFIQQSKDQNFLMKAQHCSIEVFQENQNILVFFLLKDSFIKYVLPRYKEKRFYHFVEQGSGELSELPMLRPCRRVNDEINRYYAGD